MKHTSRTLTPLLMAVVLIAGRNSFSVEPAAKPIRAVIVSGVDWPGHVWKETGPALRQLLEKDPRFDVRIVEDPNWLAGDGLAECDLCILLFKNYDPLPQEDKIVKSLVDFVQQGKGLAAIHYASGAFTNRVEFRNLLGRAQKVKHDKRGQFTVKITDSQHPVTQGMKDFEADDELFIDLQGEQPVTILATARSNITGQDHPMAFTLTHGKGRVFHTTLGHDVKALTVSGTSELIRRGALWAAQGQRAPSQQ
jgi:uncharacterized protein